MIPHAILPPALPVESEFFSKKRIIPALVPFTISGSSVSLRVRRIRRKSLSLMSLYRTTSNERLRGLLS